MTSAASTPAAVPLRGGSIDLPTGVRLHYVARGPAERMPVILLHGYSDSSFSWSRVLPLLDPALHLVAPDQRGHGRSSRAAAYPLDDLAADVLALMDALGLARAVLVGHSMGSFVAQRAALAAPARVAGLGLVGSGHRIATFAGIDELAAAVRALPDPVPVDFIRGFQESSVHVPVPAAFMDAVVAESARLDAATWRGVMAGMLATPAASGLGALGIPTWLAWGDHDTLAPRSEREALARLVGRHERTDYADTGHTPQWERPEMFARDLEGFVENVACR
jgi:pimeloyl-ACP methyl ester carboxylesterase